MPVSKSEMGTALKRLASAFGRPFGANAPAMIDEYHRALGGRLSRDELEGAVDAAIAEGERWPLPARLRSLAAAFRALQPHRTGTTLADQYRHWIARDMGGAPCPACGREATWTPRIFADCDPYVHAEQRIPAEALAPDMIEEHRRVLYARRQATA